MTTQRLFIIDAMAMAFRNYYAFGNRPLTTTNGVPTSAVYGSAVFINKLMREEKPDFFAIACDSQEPTFRHELYPKYKANRSRMPDDLAVQMPYLFKLFAGLGIPVLKQAGVEADDLIGTVAKKFASSQLDVFIVSGDKDFMQLINGHVRLYAPKKAEDALVIDEQGVMEKFACSPKQVIDCLALIGDSSDNVPGVHGIGEKGAAKLISQFGSLEGIYDSIDEITNKRQKSGLEEHKDLAFLSKKLVTLKTDIDLEFNLQDLVFDRDNALASQPLLDLYQDLEFNNLIPDVADALSKNGHAAKPEVNLEIVDATHYKLVNTQAGLNELVKTLQASSHFCFDSETTGLSVVADTPIGLSFSTQAQHGFYLPLLDKHLQGVDRQDVLQTIAPLFADSSVLKIGHNIKFDLQMLRNVGVEVAGPFADTMIASFLLDPNSREHGLDHCCLQYLSYKKIPTTELMGQKKDQPMLMVALPELTRYACEDADLTLRLFEHLIPLLKDKHLLPVFEEIEMPLVPVLAQIEQNGVYVDADVLHEISIKLGHMAQTQEEKIYELAGETFNINSTKQLQVILFENLKIHEQLGIKRLKKTKSGYSTDVSVLEKLSGHPLPKTILDFRTTTKLKNTYVDTLPQLISQKSGRIHTSFHQTGAATGRLSSSDPNLQNIPIRSALGREIRKAFKAQNPDEILISADYSQVELRLLAHIAQESSLRWAFQQNQDIHTTTAAKIFDLALDDVDQIKRSRAKAINFGIIYGMGPTRLARETGVTMQEAKEFISRYFEKYPGIKTYVDHAIESARQKGYAETITGRRRPIPGFSARDRMAVVNAENIAVNSPIQGSAADLIKLAMIKIDQEFTTQKTSAKILLQVHDELVCVCPKDEQDDIIKIIRHSMETAMDLDVPLTVDVGTGANWLEAH